ncbi:MAG: class I SAM-dependent methyltransferase [Anaerolineae bacterium]|nr:class I SAM-dependent methyltransferase [Anaerolineae bacterium]
MPTYAPFEETPYGRLHVIDHYLGHCSEELIKHLPYHPGLTILDYACGDGSVLNYLLPRTGEAWGMNPALTPVEQVSLAARMAIAHGAHLPLTSASLDAVSLHNVDPGELDAVLAEIARTLKPGGRLLWLLERQAGVDVRRVLDPMILDVLAIEPLNYLTYPTVLLLGRIPGLRRSAFGRTTMKLATVIDGILARNKAFQNHSRHLIVVAERHRDETPDA